MNSAPHNFQPNLPINSESQKDAVSNQKPHKIITVVCACILRNGGQEILMGKRKAPGVPGLDGKWELPGGKIEFGETPEAAVVREIREEIGISIAVRRLLPYLHTNVWNYEHVAQHVVLACYECELKTDDMSTFDENARWFHLNEIDFNNTLPGTREFISLAAKNQPFDRVFIRFEHPEPLNNNKHYTIATQPTLFSAYGLVKYWGRKGVTSRFKIEQFDTPQELDSRIISTAKDRLSHGYRIVELKGPERPYKPLLKIFELAKSSPICH
jgi:8-oxo-dGTP diphosphatase